MKIAIYSKNRKCYNQIQVKIFCGDEIPGVPEDGIVGSTVRRVTDGVTEKVTEKERELLGLLLEDPGYTMLQLAEKMEISRKTVAARLKSLKEKGIIERVGSDRKGYWKILH